MSTIRIGRENDNQIVLPADDRLSRYHATIEIAKDGSMILTDHSTNGTVVGNTTVNNSSIPVSYGTPVSFAGIIPLDWGRLPKTPTNQWKKTLVYVLLPLLVASVGYGIYELTRRPVISTPDPIPIDNHYTGEQIDKKYVNSVGLIIHSYYLTRTIPKMKPFYIGFNKVDPDKLDFSQNRDEILPFTNTGTGFLVNSEEGNIITNRHVANPAWSVNRPNTARIRLYNGEELSFFEQIDALFHKLKNDLNIPNLESKYELQTIEMKFLPSGSNVDIQENATVADILDRLKNVGLDIAYVREHPGEEVDLALLRSMTKVDTSEYKLINTFTEVEYDKELISVGSGVYLIGFSGGFMYSYKSTDDDIKRIFQPGNISSEPGRFSATYGMNGVSKGSSGAPVFNAQGKLIGINYRGLINVNGECILAKYMKELLEEDY